MQGRKISGGKYKKFKKKKLAERVKETVPRFVVLGEEKKKRIKMRGGKFKTVLLKANIANVFTKDGCKKVKIKNVLETSADKFLARRNIMLKGAVIETELGKAKITNRPSQEGQINAVLLD